MADNLAVTPGVGASVATDDVGGQHMQRIKLDGGGDGASVPILAGGGAEASAVRVTIANDSTGLVSVDDNGGSLTVDAAANAPVHVRLSDGTNPISALPITDNGGSVTVDNGGTFAVQVSSALPAGTNGIGKLTANSGVTIGAVELAAAQTLATVTTVSTVTNVGTIGTSVTPGTSAAHLGKAEDAVHANGDVGVMALTVRKDTAAATSGADGDYQPFVTDANGRLHTNGLMQGNLAHGVGDSGNPVKVGGVSAENVANFPIAVGAVQRTDLLTDIYGRPRVVAHPDDIKRLSVLYYHSGAFVVNAAADSAATSGGGRIWIINPVGSSVKRRLRKVTFRSQLGSALVAVTSPRFTLEKCTFTGTASGTQVTAAQRSTNDAAEVGAARTANTGMTISAAAVICSFFPTASASAVGYAAPAEASFEPGPEDYVDILPGECLVLRQADAGTVSDTRRCTADFVVEEY